MRGTDIYVMNADGTHAVQLTNTTAFETSSPTLESGPTWSPDLKNPRIAFDSYASGNWEIYSMKPDGSNVVRHTNNAALDVGPSWTR